jgi:hypothetical protein
MANVGAMDDSSAAEAKEEERRISGLDIAWVLIMITGWVIVAAMLVTSPSTADRFWEWSTDLALWQRVIEWIVLLPWMVGLWIWESDWGTSLRVAGVSVVAIAWIVASWPGVGR